MASVITVTVAYMDGSRTLSLEYPCADNQPSAAVLRDCERDAYERFEPVYLSGSTGVKTNTKVKVVK